MQSHKFIIALMKLLWILQMVDKTTAQSLRKLFIHWIFSFMICIKGNILKKSESRKCYKGRSLVKSVAFVLISWGVGGFHVQPVCQRIKICKVNSVLMGTFYSLWWWYNINDCTLFNISKCFQIYYDVDEAESGNLMDVWLLRLPGLLPSLSYNDTLVFYFLTPSTLPNCFPDKLSFATQKSIVNRIETCGIIFLSHKWSNSRVVQHISYSKFLKTSFSFAKRTL